MNALVVGSGWARNAGAAFASHPRVRVAGVVARGSPRSVALARTFDVPLFASVADAIAETRPSLAVVAVGDRHNAELSRELLAAGAHVLCAHPVAATADEVAALARFGRERGLVASTDYSMRVTPAFRAAVHELASVGELLRVDIMFPGRFLPIALDLALEIAGAASALTAFGSYPPSLDVRRAAAPSAFPPTVVLEHARGVVSALTPVPHASPGSAIRITASAAGGRIDLALPDGGARRTRVSLSAKRGFEEKVLEPEEPCDEAREVYAVAMERLATAFVDCIPQGGPPPCPLDCEVDVRRLWRAVQVGARTGARVELAEG